MLIGVVEAVEESAVAVELTTGVLESGTGSGQIFLANAIPGPVNKTPGIARQRNLENHLRLTLTLHIKSPWLGSLSVLKMLEG